VPCSSHPDPAPELAGASRPRRSRSPLNRLERPSVSTGDPLGAARRQVVTRRRATGAAPAGTIGVEPPALLDVARQLHAEAGRTEHAVAAGGGRACVSSGCPQVDAALAAFTSAWTNQSLALARVTDQFAQAVVIASDDYQTTDENAMPLPGGGR
jgi:hypothetical protein